MRGEPGGLEGDGRRRGRQEPLSRIRRMFHLGLWGPGLEEGVEWEIEHHIQERADELEAEGLSRRDAEREARGRFGDVAAVRRELRATDRSASLSRGIGLWVETWLQDLRYGLRGIGRSPGFSASLVLTLGLGIGAAVAVFGIVDALLLRPLPYADSSELADVSARPPGNPYAQHYLPWGIVKEWRDRDRAFDGMLPHSRASALYTGGDEPESVATHQVTASFEEVLGVRPVLGRGLLPEDARPGAERVALVSDGFWRSALGGDPEVVGRRVLLDDVAHTVIGVMPRGFKFPEYSSTEFWVPLEEDMPGTRGVELLARVPDANLDAAIARAAGLASALFEGHPRLDSAVVELTPMEAQRGGGPELRGSVWLLFAAVGLILLVAAFNGANLLLVRGAVRSREIAVRGAIGASRGRIVRQLMTETMALSILSGAAAVGIAFVALRGLQGLIPHSLLFFLPYAVAVEQRALVFAFAIAAGTGLLLGLLPALRSTRGAAAARGALTAYAFQTRARSRLRRGLAVAEVALSVVLWVGAGLLLNSFLRLNAVDIGVQTDHVGFAKFMVSSRSQPDSAALASFLPRLEERVRALPGVTAATATGSLPSGMVSFGTHLQAEGQPPAGGDPDVLPRASLSPEAFDLLGIRLLAGRPFGPGDASADVAIVDEDLARHLWPGGDAVGRRFRLDEDRPWLTVVGVVTDIQLERRDDRHGDFEILEPFDPTTARGAVTLAFRTTGDPTRLLPAVRAAIHEIAPRQPIWEMNSAADAYAETLQLPKFLAVLVSAVAAFALLLAAVGLFGILTFEVTQRTRELGVRMALGADRRRLRRMVVQEGLLLAIGGATIGLAAALGLARFIRGMLFDLEPTDPATLALVVVTILATAAASSYLPARRATRLDPADVMRAE